MQPQVTFRGLFPSQAIVDTVWRSARELGLRSPSLSLCHVVI